MRRTPHPTSPTGATRPIVLYVPGAALFFNTTQRSIRARVATNRLPFHRLDGKIIFYQHELEEFLGALPGIGVDEALKNCGVRR